MEHLVHWHGNDLITILLSLKYWWPMLELKFVHSHKQALAQQNTLCEAWKKGRGEKTGPLTLTLQLTAQFPISLLQPTSGKLEEKRIVHMEKYASWQRDVGCPKREKWIVGWAKARGKLSLLKIHILKARDFSLQLTFGSFLQGIALPQSKNQSFPTITE